MNNDIQFEDNRDDECDIIMAREIQNMELNKQTPLEKHKNRPLSELDNFALPNGKMAGKRFIELYRHEGKYVKWVLANKPDIKSNMALFKYYINRKTNDVLQRNKVNQTINDAMNEE